MNKFTSQDITIRDEKENDFFLVEKMIRQAFWNVYKPECDEHYLTHILRLHGDYIPELTRVAVFQGEIVGAIFYAKSKLICKDRTYEVITFGPLGVDPRFQRQGIGAMLMRETIEAAKNLGYKAIIIYGEPDYYPRFGFQRAEAYNITQPARTYLDALMVYELEDEFLQNKEGNFEISRVYLNFNKPDVEKFDRQFQ